MSEHAEQVAVIAWRDYNVSRWPCLRWLHAIPNGGHRNIKVARKLKAEGVTPGVSDLCLPYPARSYHGLYIELKTKTGKATAVQKEFIAYADTQGYKAAVCYSAQEAIELIEKYLECS